MDNYLSYKTKASLHLDGLAYNCGEFRILILRATQRPSNRLIGIVLDIEALGLETSSARGALGEILEVFQESAIGVDPRAKLKEIEEVYGGYYSLAEDSFEEHYITWGLQLVQLMQQAMGT